MGKRFLAFVLSLLMVGTLCTLPAEASVEGCNFYLEFVSFGEPGCHVNWDDQVKWVGYSHCVNLYHKVGQDYVKIDAGSLTSNNPSVVSVEYCETDKWSLGAAGYYDRCIVFFATDQIK